MIRKGTFQEGKYVAGLIIKLLGGEELPPGEQEYLQDWIQRSPLHKSTYDDLTDPQSIIRELQTLLRTDVNTEWMQCEQKTGIKEKNTGNEGRERPLYGILSALIMGGMLQNRTNQMSTPLCSLDNVKSLK